MKVSELIKELHTHDPDMDIGVVVSITQHYCSDGYCYCNAEDEYFNIEGISKNTEYDKKTKKQVVKGLSIRGG